MINLPLDYFKDEVRDGFYISPHIKQAWGAQLKVLSVIDEICKKHNITYFADWGTLLATVRHGGYVPWDDDLDFFMPRKDYEKFSKLCSSQLDEKYYLHNIETDNKYWLPFAKIRKKNTVFDEKCISHLNVKKGIFVDIWAIPNPILLVYLPKRWVAALSPT